MGSRNENRTLDVVLGRFSRSGSLVCSSYDDCPLRGNLPDLGSIKSSDAGNSSSCEIHPFLPVMTSKGFEYPDCGETSELTCSSCAPREACAANLQKYCASCPLGRTPVAFFQRQRGGACRML